jgi:hypothetical protein
MFLFFFVKNREYEYLCQFEALSKNILRGVFARKMRGKKSPENVSFN